MLNKPSPRLQILRAEIARNSVDLSCERIMYAASAHHPRVSRALPPVADDMPLPPSYDEDLADWLKSLDKKAAPLGDLQKAITHAQPSASAWRRGTDIPVAERVGLWHHRAPGADTLVERATDCRQLGWYWDTEYCPAAAGVERGDPYDESRYATASLAPSCRRCGIMKYQRSLHDAFGNKAVAVKARRAAFEVSDRADREAARMICDLKMVAKQLRIYEAHHRAKGTVENDAKDDVNEMLAARCEETIKLVEAE